MKQKLNDFHIHFGQFREYLFEAEHIKDLIEAIGIDKFGIMPTSTTGTQDYEWEISEAKKIMELLPNQAVPYLRVYPEMLKKSNDLSLYNDLPYKLIKIHGYAHDWAPKGKALERIYEIANERKLPILFHTGGREESDAGQYLHFSKKFKDVTVVLAHGRPVEQAISVMQDCENVYTDTAFMALNDIQTIVDANLGERIIFGTDFPINIAFFDDEPEDWYSKTVNNMISQFGEELFTIWANDNFNKILNISDTRIS
jgi:predicted TIM-barrel fold metal-dependent hydrolase